MAEIKTVRTLIAGISGMGKSWFVKNRLIPELAKSAPVIIFDRKDEYEAKGWKRHANIYAFLHSLRGNKKLKGVHVIVCNSDDDYNRGLVFFQVLNKPVSLILDEAHDIFLDRDFYNAKKNLVKMVRYGRSAGISVILISQRTKDIPPDIRSQFLGCISFKQTHQDDIKALDERGWANAKKVLDLNPRQYEILGEFDFQLKK